MNPFAVLRIHEVRELLRQKKVSPVEILRAYRRQADKVNIDINAIVAERWDQAFLEARDLEKRLMSGANIPCLAGLPFTAKELFEVDGLPHTLGIESRRHQTAKNTSSAVKMLIKEGAICAGVTNVPELGFWFETYNQLYGTTSNPYDLRRTAGGSSGGEAAIIAAMGSAFGLGSDIGGSIRIPAAFCGLFGHKPTRFIIPFSGHYPVVAGREAELTGDGNRVTVVGPMARFADDLIELFKVLARPDGLDRDVKESQFDFSPISWKGRKVFTLKDPRIRWTYPTDHSLQQSVDQAAKFFEEQGAIVEELDSRLLKNAFELWNEACSMIRGPSLHESLGPGVPSALGTQFLKLLIGKADVTLPTWLSVVGEKYFKPLIVAGEYQHELATLKAHFSEILGTENILLMPPHPRPAFLHYSAKLRPFDFAYAGVWNALDFPVTQAPTGFNGQALPLGVQIVANRWNDALSLLAAKDLEKAFGGWRPPKENLRPE